MLGVHFKLSHPHVRAKLILTQELSVAQKKTSLTIICSPEDSKPSAAQSMPALHISKQADRRWLLSGFNQQLQKTATQTHPDQCQLGK